MTTLSLYCSQHRTHTLTASSRLGVYINGPPTPDRPRRALIFNCTSGRSAESLLGSLTDSMAERLVKCKSTHGASEAEQSEIFDDVIFCPNTTYSDGTFSGGMVIRTGTWLPIHPLPDESAGKLIVISALPLSPYTYDLYSYEELLSKATDTKDLVELTVQNELAQAWDTLSRASDSKVSPRTKVHVLPSIQHAVGLIEKTCNGRWPSPDSGRTEAGVDVLVTGSLHLIGGVFDVAKLEYAL